MGKLEISEVSKLDVLGFPTLQQRLGYLSQGVHTAVRILYISHSLLILRPWGRSQKYDFFFLLPYKVLDLRWGETEEESKNGDTDATWKNFVSR